MLSQSLQAFFVKAVAHLMFSQPPSFIGIVALIFCITE